MDCGEGEGECGLVMMLMWEEVACLDYVFETRDENGEWSLFVDCVMVSGEDVIESVYLCEWVVRNMFVDVILMVLVSVKVSGFAVAVVVEMAANVSESDVV